MMRFVLAALAFLFINGLFTFENVPSTPLVRLAPRLSVEVLLSVGFMALTRWLGFRFSRLARGVLALVVFAAAFVRYVDLTVLGVLGRPFDLYGDSPHVHRVIAGFLESLTPALGLGIVSGLVLLVLLAFGLNWMALGLLDRAFDAVRLRAPVTVCAAAGLLLFPFAPAAFSATATSIIARQLAGLRAGATELDVAALERPPRHTASSLTGLRGAHVFIVFVESYGITVLEDKEHFDVIGPRYRTLETNLRQAGYAMASSRMLSPTFGGGSWRAHATLLSGFEASSERLYDALLKSDRTTLVRLLKQRGYRAVAAEPGIQRFWPEGLFYGFDKIYDFNALDYRGPAIGWWKIPDQFTLYRMYENEIRSATVPVFAKFSLVMTHIPYFPVPEYVPDWTRFDQGTAYDKGLQSVAHDAYRDLLELSSWYLAAMRYELDVLEGFLLKYVPDNSLVIILGDHQPPKLAMHDNSSWAVPMHVLSKRADSVRAFDELGFEDTLVPSHPSTLRMSEFLDGFLKIYGEDEHAAQGPPGTVAAGVRDAHEANRSVGGRSEGSP